MTNVFLFFSLYRSLHPTDFTFTKLLSAWKIQFFWFSFLLHFWDFVTMSRSPDVKEDPVECPLCMEPLEIDDINFFPCTCGYQICRFCWHRIRTDENGLCPACRKVSFGRILLWALKQTCTQEVWRPVLKQYGGHHC